MIKLPEAPSYASNYVRGILDEIALEGLDGITPNDLWVRLDKRPYFPCKPKDEATKSFLWETVKRLKTVSFFELPEQRPPLVIFDRFEHIDPELGMVIEPENMPQNIYPHYKVEDPTRGILGSCATYHTRKDVTDLIQNLSYQEVDTRWGHKLVVVASQAARRRALQNPDVNPNMVLTPMQYLVLERVGRSRYHGEITQGSDSLQIVGEDPKSLFYLRKVLHKHRLITKQMFHQKLGTQNLCGLLLHLPRFFVERRPKALTMIEQIIIYLKNKPNYMEEYNILRQSLNLGQSLKKLTKTYNFQKFVKTDLVLHRTMYPDAEESEWRYKGANKERSVRVLYLIDGNLDPKDVWQKYDDIYDDEDDDKCGVLDEGRRLLDRTLMSQAYAALEAAGPSGLTQVALGAALGASKLSARMIVRNMTRSNKVTTFMRDEGRQRTAKFALKKFDKCSDVQKQMTEEKDKLMKYVNMGNEDLGGENEDLEDSFQNSECMQVEDLENSLSLQSTEISVADTSIVTNLDREFLGKEWKSKKTHLASNTETLDKIKVLENSINENSKGKAKSKTRKRRKDLTEAETDGASKKKKIKDTEKKLDIVEKPEIPNENAHGTESKHDSESLGPDDATKEEVELEITSIDTPTVSKTLSTSRLSSNPTGLEHNTVSFRLLKRTNLIMEAVHKQKVIIDTSKLQKMIFEEENKEGYDVRMDKKSLLRIINKLAQEGHVKHLQMTLRGYGKVKQLTFICHPSVTADHSVIQSAVDQAKMKFTILGKEASKKNKTQAPVKQKDPNVESLDDTFPPTPSKKINLKYNNRMGRQYGFKPKYMRMQVLHKYMFYLINGYEGDVSFDQQKAMEELQIHCDVTDDVREEMSHVFTPSMDWKMFVPPLPVHSGYPNGWALVSDMLLRLPLSIFIQLVNVMYELPNIEEYLNHPIKKHFLVKNLPLHFRTALTFARKYIFTIHEQIVRLCCTGLLQMGPQRLKDKDQVFVYVNRKVVLWDTTSSPAGYHQIEKDREYPLHLYHFHTLADVDQYWYDLWNFCMHTMLGGRMCMTGKEVVLEGLANKPEMLEALESRTVSEAPARDVGYLPGDHLGAAGFDSAMFAHLKRNWYWNTTKINLGTKQTPAPAPTTDLQPVVHSPKKDERKIALKPVRVISETSSAKRKGGRRESRPELKETLRLVKKKATAKRTVRMLKNRTISGRKPYYDQADREALLKMNKLRVEWSAKEDNLLLLCKVAFVIFQFIGKRYMNLVVVRQILHEQCPEATDKTSRACQRRLNYIMKNSQTQRSVNLCVEEMKQDSVVMKRLKDLKDRTELEVKEEREQRWTESYKDLVLLLQERYKKLHSHQLSELSEGFLIPDSVQELREHYRILRPQSAKLKKRAFNTVNAVSDVHAGVINATILSSLNCVGDKTSWSYQLFHIYQQYPDKLLRTVMAKTRADQMVSLRKRYLRTHIRSGDYLPLSSSPYQLSISYINLLMTRYQSQLYGDCLRMLRRLEVTIDEGDGDSEGAEEGVEGKREPVEVVAARGGAAACVVELASNDLIDFKLETPEQIIVMDPNVIVKDETYTRIVQRYHDILAKCKEPDQVTITAIFDEAYNNHSQDLNEIAEEELYIKPQQNTTIAKAATRIALYMTREECDKNSGTVDHQEIQHAHDFFVVNASKVYCNLTKINKEKEDSEHFDPVPKEKVNNILSKLKRHATFPDKTAIEPELISEISSIVEVREEFVEEVLEFIKSKKETGATIDEIREIYGTESQIGSLLHLLVDSHVLLRNGVTTTHLVHAAHVRPWLVRSYHVPRLQREGTKDKAKPGLVINVGENVQPAAVETGTDVHIPEEAKPLVAPTDAPAQQESVTRSISPTPSTSSATLPPRQRRAPAHFDNQAPDSFVDSGVKRSSSKFISTGSRKLKKASFDPKSKCELNVNIRPWIRINGSVNRRALDKFLTSVLGHVMTLPLCSLQAVQDRFTPAFQPHHTRELVEVLEELNCLKMLAVKHSHKPSLFSKPTKVYSVPATGLEKEEEILLEPDSMAITRLACFIGDSAYQKDIFAITEIT